MSSEVTLPRDSKGKRPHFFDDPAVDQLYSILLELTAELSVAYDRIDTLERLLDRHGVLPRSAVEAYRPDEAVEDARAAWREAYLKRVFRIFEQGRTRMESAAEMDAE